MAKRPTAADIYAQDENWFVLTCTHCFGLFDVPRSSSGKRLREVCEECREQNKLRYQRSRRAAVSVHA